MKKIAAAIVGLGALGAVPALAADLPARAPAPRAPIVYAPAYNWTGFYLGINGGYGFLGQKTTDTFRTTPGGVVIGAFDSKDEGKGWIFGGQAGYNWQQSNWVVGIEFDGQGTGIKSDNLFVAPAGVLFGASAAFSQKLDWFASARARAGVLVTPDILFYATGGFAGGNVKTAFTLLNPTGSASFTDSVAKGGFIVGAGIEGMFANNWMLRAQYDYLDLGKINTGGAVLVGGPFHHDSFETRYYQHMVRVGLSYKFGGNPSPVVARY